MSRQSIKYGVDRCPATKNYSNLIFCRNCDFKSSTSKDCCQCMYNKYSQQEDEKPAPVH